MTPLENSRRTLMRGAVLGAAASLLRPACAFAGGAPLDELAYALLIGMRSSEVQRFLNEWPSPAPRRMSIASPLPVLRYLPTVRAHAAPFSKGLVAPLAEIARSLAWRRSYSRSEVSSQFLDNYGWSELVGLTGPLPSDRLACGVLLLGPGTAYPAHHHEAEEIYIPLSGTAAWKQGDGGWEDKTPGTMIHHRPQESHAMRTAQSPLLALYLWRSDNLAQKSHLDCAPGCPD